jgi:hypothetical protein
VKHSADVFAFGKRGSGNRRRCCDTVVVWLRLLDDGRFLAPRGGAGKSALRIAIGGCHFCLICCFSRASGYKRVLGATATDYSEVNLHVKLVINELDSGPFHGVVAVATCRFALTMPKNQMHRVGVNDGFSGKVVDLFSFIANNSEMPFLVKVCRQSRDSRDAA